MKNESFKASLDKKIIKNKFYSSNSTEIKV